MAQEQILVIDDQTASRAFIVDTLSSTQGYRAIVAGDAGQALQKAVDIRPDLIVLNGASATLGGLGVLESLRERGIPAPALLVLASGSTRLDVRAFQLGVSQVVTEPLDASTLDAAIERALRPGRLHRAGERMREQAQDQMEEQKRLYTIGRALAAQIDHQQVCNRLVEASVYVSGADGGSLFLQDSDTGEVRLRSQIKNGAQVAQTVDQVVQDPLVQRVLSSGSPHVLSETSTELDDIPAPALVDVPLKTRNQCIGVLRVLRSDAGNPFGASEYHKLSVLTGYATLAIENIDLADGLQDAMERTAICQISTFFAARLHLEQVLSLMMDVVARIAGADRGYIVLLDDQTGEYVPRVSHAFNLQEINDPWFVPAKQVVLQVLESRHPVRAVVGGTDIPARAVLCMPVESDSSIIGAIYVERRDPTDPFTEIQHETLVAVSRNAAMALENARLFEQVETEGRKLDAVLRGTDQPVIVTDMHGTVTLMNQAARRTFSSQQGKGTGLLFPHAVEHPGLTNLFEQARVSGQVQRGEIVADDDRTLSATVTLISNVGAVMVLQDITEIKKLSQLKIEFVATVSHDLRSPLSAVQGFLSVLDQAGPINDQQADFIASAQREVTRLFDLTGDLLDLGRLESGIDLDMAPCDLGEVIESAIASWQSQAQAMQHLLFADLPPEGVRIFGNSALLRRVIDNLLSNAIKYMPPGGQIDVQLSQVGHEAVLRVQDAGIGIAANDQPYVFDRFYRVRNEHTRDVEGTGLGLAIVRSIIERHGGRVWLDSELGRGTTVEVMLPIMED